MEMERRNFMKLAAMTAATGLAGSMASRGATALASTQPPLPDRPDIPGVTWNKAPCRFCGTGCHVQVGVQDDKVVAIAGDRQAEVNKGLLCVKGYHVGMILYGQDRLTKPMARRDGELVEIEWDEAIDIVAKRIMKSGEKFGFYISGQSTVPEGYAAQKLMRGGLSSNHLEANARLCMASAVTGFLSTYGVDEPASCYDDLDHCDTLILWGNNPAEMHPILFSRVMDRQARGEKVTLIDIGSRHTRTTERADHFLPMRGNGDLAIANCIAQQLIEQDAYDHDFVDKHCNFRADRDPSAKFDAPVDHDTYVDYLKEEGATGLFGEAISFEQYKILVSYYTPEKAEELSGVPASQLRMLASVFADKSKKIVSLWCMGMNQHTAGTAINNLVHNVHLMSGHWGKPGDGPQSLTGQPAACGTVREVGTLAHALPGGRVIAKEAHREQAEGYWNVPKGRINPKPGYHTVKMFEQLCTPTDQGGDIDTVWVQVTNPGQTLPNTKKLFKAKAELKDKFLIVSEVYPTATTELADLVLPAAMWVEKNGVYGNSERRTQQWFKMVTPPGEARDDCWQTLAVARRLYELGHPGLKDKDGEYLFRINDDDGNEVPYWEWEHYYDINVDKVLFDEYRQFTFMKHKNVAPYDELVKHRGMRWPVIETEDGQFKETRWRFVEGADDYVEKGAEIQFYHSVTKDNKAQLWFRPHQWPAEVPDDALPLNLVTGRVIEHWHSGTMTMRVPQLRRAMPGAYVEMNPDDARDRGISNGDIVRVTTRRGEMKLPAWINGRAKPLRGNVFVPFFDEASQINDLTLGAIDPFSKQPDYKKCAVEVSRLDQPHAYSPEDDK
jgi:nitrate reductase NapA